MPSSEKFRDYVLGQFNGKLLEGGFRVTTRKMMGEYILYADGKIFGEASGCDAPGTACCESEEEKVGVFVLRRRNDNHSPFVFRPQDIPLVGHIF